MRFRNFLQLFLVITVSFLSGTVAHATYQKISLRDFQPEGIKEARVGQASWYSHHSPGVKKTTANMEVFDDTALTCAMWDVPFHQMIRVTNLENGKSVVVRVNDRGPHKRLVRKGRVVDLSKAAFQKIASLKKGLISVKVEFL